MTPRIKALRRSALDIYPKTTQRLLPVARSILEANAGKASMMARCADKTHLHNIQPEDPRGHPRRRLRHRDSARRNEGGFKQETEER